MLPLPLVISAAKTLASTIVSADRIEENNKAFGAVKDNFAQTLAKVDDGKGKVVDSTAKVEGETITVYGRGKDKIQALAKVAPDAAAVAALEKAGKLAVGDNTLETLTHASAQNTLQAPSNPATIADVNKALQAGGERMRQAVRLGANVHLQG
jgi:hypothetical protein